MQLQKIDHRLVLLRVRSRRRMQLNILTFKTARDITHNRQIRNENKMMKKTSNILERKKQYFEVLLKRKKKFIRGSEY